MRRFTLLCFVLGLLVFNIPTSFSQKEFKGKLLPEKNLTGTTLNSISPDPVYPGTFDVTFSLYIQSTDLEYADRVEITLPTGWVINSVSHIPENSDCECTTTEGNTGQMVWWQINETMPSYWGPWYGLTDFIANVTIADCSGSPWDIGWTAIGDYYGQAPHTASGIYSMSCTETPPAYIQITPNVFCQNYNGSFSEGGNVTFELDLEAGTGYNFSLCGDDLCCGGDYIGYVDGDLTMYDGTMTQVWYIDGESSCNYNASTKPDYPAGWAPSSTGTYYLKVDDFSAGACTAYTLAYQIASPVLSLTTSCQTVDGSFGTGEGVYYEMYLTTGNDYNFSTCANDPCAGGTGYDVDFRMYNAAGSQLWYIDGSGSCSYHASTYGQAQEDWTPPADGCYYLYIDEYGTGSGSVDYTLAYISASAFVLTNDLCADAITVTCGSATAGTTTGATFDNAGTCGTSNTQPGVWYKITGTGNTFSADLCTGTSWDSKITVFEGTCANLICVDGNDDFCSLQSRVDWFAENGIDYYILVHQYGAGGGAFTLTLDCTSPVTATWQGDDNTDYNDWFGANNWDIQDVPGSTTDVILPAGLTYYPTLDRNGICDDITMHSDENGTATLLDNGNLSVSGTATVERYFSGNDPDYHLISSPISNATASVFLNMYLMSFNPLPSAPYGPPDFGYSNIINPATGLTVMRGYALFSALADENTVSFEGNLNFGNRSRSYNLNGNNPDGWNLFGNPYPSSIDWNAVTIPGSMNGEVHYIEASTGADISYVSGGGGGGRYIPPMQGFFISALTAGSLQLTDAVRTHTGADTYYKSEMDNLLVLEASGNGFKNEARIYFNGEATNEHDRLFDAYKIITTSNPLLPQIYSITPEGVKLAINGMPETNMVPVGIMTGNPGEYMISATETSDFANVILEDLLTGFKTDLLKESYSFEYGLNESENRFIIHFTPLAISENPTNSINIYSFNQEVYISVPEGGMGTVKVYSLMGQEVTNSPINSTLTKIHISNMGHYLVEVISNGGVITKKVFVK
jgi:hypothetical protein